jgi:hypothetical protein
MKKINLTDIIKWNSNGKLYQCVGLIKDSAACLVSLADQLCPHCGNPVGKDSITSIITSPQFQKNAEKPTGEDFKKMISTLQKSIPKQPEPIKTGKIFLELLRNKYFHGIPTNSFLIQNSIRVELVEYFPDDVFMIGNKVFRIEEEKRAADIDLNLFAKNSG